MSASVSVIIATYNRKEDLVDAIESTLSQEYDDFEIVVVCNSTDDTPSLFAEDARFDLDSITYIHEDERMGVAKARNLGYTRAKGDILVTIDDDAVFEHDGVLEALVEEFSNDRSLGIIAFRVLNDHTGEIETLPRKNKGTDPNERFTAPYFIGCGNAIRSSVFEDVGYYPESFRYGAEELDFSYRAIDAGYSILYLPEATVVHKESPQGRFRDSTVRRYLVENRFRFVVRNLPWKYAVPYMFSWTLYVLYLSNFDPRPVLKAYQTGLAESKELLTDRSVVDDETISYIKKHSGRLFY